MNGRNPDDRSMPYVSIPGDPVFDVTRRRYIVDRSLDHASPLGRIFRRIYHTNKWGSSETRSGPGSECDRTKSLASELPVLMHSRGIRSILDAPCGEFNWMRDVDLNGVVYTGMDIVPELIQRNRQRFKHLSFTVADITRSELPTVDLILCRDGLVHLSNIHLMAALANFKRSNSKYLLTTTFTKTDETTEIASGWWRPINLELPPFELPKPLIRINDSDSDDFYNDKTLSLWKLTEIQLSAK